MEITAGGGLLTSGEYFTGPGSLELAAGDALAGSLQVRVPVHRAFAVVVAGIHARPKWQLTGVPLIGALNIRGARLWFADAALRGQTTLGSFSGAPLGFAQAGLGLARYSLSTSVRGTRVDEQATNVAVALGAGVTLPVARRVGVELIAKDYIASFRSVRDLEAFGVEGRRAHTLLLLLGAQFAW